MKIRGKGAGLCMKKLEILQGDVNPRCGENSLALAGDKRRKSGEAGKQICWCGRTYQLTNSDTDHSLPNQLTD
jgi:hypothetical protein